jgi:hypothetical protein
MVIKVREISVHSTLWDSDKANWGGVKFVNYAESVLEGYTSLWKLPVLNECLWLIPQLIQYWKAAAAEWFRRS